MRHTVHFLTLLAAALLLNACNGMFDGLYDDAVSDDQQHQGFSGDDGNGRFQISLDARSYAHWYYINLHRRTIDTVAVTTALTGQWDGRSQWTYYNVRGTVYTEKEVRKVNTQPEPQEWDIAIHHFDVKTNGGAATVTQYSSIDDMPSTSSAFVEATFTEDEWTTHQCIVDLSTMMAYDIWYASSYVNRVLTGWVTMDISSPPPVYSSSQRAYVLRMKDGTYAALRLISYMSDRGTKGYLIIDVKYPY